MLRQTGCKVDSAPDRSPRGASELIRIRPDSSGNGRALLPDHFACSGQCGSCPETFQHSPHGPETGLWEATRRSSPNRTPHCGATGVPVVCRSSRAIRATGIEQSADCWQSRKPRLGAVFGFEVCHLCAASQTVNLLSITCNNGGYAAFSTSPFCGWTPLGRGSRGRSGSCAGVAPNHKPTAVCHTPRRPPALPPSENSVLPSAPFRLVFSAAA